MKNSIILLIKGAFIGIANVIPGLSGGTIAITLGIYEILINSISNFFGNIKKNFKFLLLIGLGAGISILLTSKFIVFTLDEFPLPTTLFFIGLILGGVPLLTKKINKENKNVLNIMIFIISFIIVISFTLISIGGNAVNFDTLKFTNIILIFLSGLIAAATMIVPGISGSFILMLLGYYKPIIETIGDLTNFNNLIHNLTILIPFGIGAIIGIIIVSKIIGYLLDKYEEKTYFAIIGIIFASVIVILKPLFLISLDIPQLMIGLGLGLIGYFIAYRLGDE